MNWIAFIGVFAAYVILDIVFAEYTMACADRRTWRAAWFAGLIPLLSGTVVLAYVEDPVYLIAAMLGGYYHFNSPPELLKVGNEPSMEVKDDMGGGPQTW